MPRRCILKVDAGPQSIISRWSQISRMKQVPQRSRVGVGVPAPTMFSFGMGSSPNCIEEINGYCWQGVKLVGRHLHNGFLRENSEKKCKKPPTPLRYRGLLGVEN